MKRVLDVGNCVPDHSAISHLLTSHFDVEVTQAHARADALKELEKRAYDLVLVNRKLDCDYSDGIEVLRAIKAQFSSVPVMLITNYADHQRMAIAAGGIEGFGKLTLQEPATIERLRVYLE